MHIAYLTKVINNVPKVILVWWRNEIFLYDQYRHIPFQYYYYYYYYYYYFFFFFFITMDVRASIPQIRTPRLISGGQATPYQHVNHDRRKALPYVGGSERTRTNDCWRTHLKPDQLKYLRIRYYCYNNNSNNSLTCCPKITILNTVDT